MERGKEEGILMKIMELQVDLWKVNRSPVIPGVWVQSLLKLGHWSGCMCLRGKLESTGAAHLNPRALSLP